MTSHGFMLGKFMPPHAGHLFCAEVGKRRCDVMTLLVCSHDAEPIDGHLRAAWVRSCLPAPQYRVRHMHRDIPQTPEDHPEFWPIWRAVLAEFHPEPIDWVFGSEDYITQLADEAGARPFLVDPERRIVPVSARQIRAAPARHWSHVPPPVRAHYQRRLVLVGAESTGKTTLANMLARRINCDPIPEYGRSFDATFRRGQGWAVQDFEAIIAGHIAYADAHATRASAIVIEDTDPVQTLVWAEALLGHVPKSLIAPARRASRAKTYLLLDHTTPWHDDGTRYFPDPEQRAFFTDRLAAWLETFGADWQLIAGQDWAARTAAAHARLDALDTALG